MEINKIKQSKLFHRWDILIYIILAVLIVLSFIIFIPKTDSTFDVIEMKYKDEVILNYSFSKDKFSSQDSNHISIKKEDDVYLITFFETNINTNYNIIKIDPKTKQVSLTNSDCSSHKDCTKMTITKSSDTIICLPHSLIIYANSSSITDPTIG